MSNKLKSILSIVKGRILSNSVSEFIKDINYYFYKLNNRKNLKYILRKLNNIHINGIFNTLQILINSNKSIGRFGDGDLSNMLIDGTLNDAEKHSKSLSRILKKILNNNNKNFMVSLPDAFVTLDNYNMESKRYWIKFINKYGNKILPYLSKYKTYYDTSITRPYMDFENKKDSGLIFYLMKSIWCDKNVLIIEGKQSRVGVTDDLLNEALNIKRIECPITNAFESRRDILNSALKFLNHHKDYISLISLGSTATVLSFDLCNKGYRSIDIGNLDLEYEWYLHNASHKINLPYKYVLEAPNGRHALPIPSDNKYYKEIIHTI